MSLARASIAFAWVIVSTVGAVTNLNFAYAADCSILKDVNYSQGDLYAVTGPSRHKKITHLDPAPFGNNSIEFDPKVTLIYVLDKPPAQRFGISRNFSGVIAARLVSTAANSNRPIKPPKYVHLRRDSVVTRRSRRHEWSGEVTATRYYVYHNPHELRASDSYLEREFHTEYTYRRGEPDRKTYEPRERRSQFAFPQMHSTEPTNPLDRLVSAVFGGTALASDDKDTRFEAQIKYYRQTNKPRCVNISTQLSSRDNGTLQVTLTDLDYPLGLANDSSSETWTITWNKLKQPR